MGLITSGILAQLYRRLVYRLLSKKFWIHFMSRIIYCNKLQKDAEGLNRIPWPGDLGKKIYDSISAEAWQLWLNHQTMLINEYD